mgnify:CR=1 FL=1
MIASLREQRDTENPLTKKENGKDILRQKAPTFRLNDGNEHRDNVAVDKLMPPRGDDLTIDRDLPRRNELFRVATCFREIRELEELAQLDAAATDAYIHASM